jgi:hypothetical protein
VIYVAVRGTAVGGTQIAGGVYRVTFTQSGSTLANLTSGVAPGSVATDVVVDPTNPLVLYAGLVEAADHSKNGIYKSTDGGNNWQLLTNGLTTPADIGNWIALAMAPFSVYTTIFESGNSSATPMLRRFLTTDAGASWSTLNPPVPGCPPNSNL